MADQQDNVRDPNARDQDAGNVAGGSAAGDAAREGHSERAGEGGYGNDTGFATGTQGSREDDGGGSVDAGTSAREQQTSNTYRDAGQGHGSPDATEGGAH